MIDNLIHWAGIPWWLAACVIMSLVSLISFKFYNQIQAVKLLGVGALGKTLLKYCSSTLIISRFVAAVAALFMIGIALMQPQWGAINQVVHQEGRDVLVLLDISRSMLAQDIKPSRIAMAKIKVRNLVSQLKTERVGLILFSGTSILQCPLTKDLRSFFAQLDAADTETISSGTTVLGKALSAAAAIFKKIPTNKNKIVLVVTDGEDFSKGTEAVINELKAQNITLLALGVGSPEGAPIPQVDERNKIIGHERDETGQLALSKLNESFLKDITQRTSGEYAQITPGDADVAQLLAAVSKIEKEFIDDRTLSLYHDQYPWFLAAAWVFFAVEWLL